MTNKDIAAVERDTGLSKDTLRVWERRYGFPQPLRGAVGLRAYPPEQVEKLRVMKRLLDGGYRPGKLVALTMDELRQLGQTPVGEPGATMLPLPARYVELLRAHDIAGLRAQLRQALHELGLERFVVELVAALNVAVGDAWANGQVSVAQEHVYTEAVQAVLREGIGKVPQAPAGAPLALLATLPQEAHGLGLLMVEALLGLNGCRCIALGVKVPLDGIADAALMTGAQVVGLGFSANFNAVQAVAGLKDMRSRLPRGVQLWAGGRHPALQRNLPDGVQAVPDIALVPALLNRLESSIGLAGP